MSVIISHICNKGDQVIFCDEQDYICMNNKIATTAYQLRIQVLAFSIMSTHVHIVVKAPDAERVDEFMKTLRKSYNITYSRKYSPIVLNSLQLESHVATSAQDVKNKIAYVCRNCVHHSVASFPFAYRFTSAKYYFWNEVMGDEFELRRGLIPLSQASRRRQEAAVSNVNVPGDWLIDDKNMISPLSFVNIEVVRDIWWNKVGSFMVDMNKELRDSDGNVLSEDVLELRSSLKGDVEACAMIAKALETKGLSSIHLLQPQEKQWFADMLRFNGFGQEQSRRCLWL